MSVIRCGTRLYTVTPDDRLWLLRAVQCEGNEETQVAQVLVNCFAYLHANKPKSCASLTWLVRSYAQPVNPTWFPGGSNFERWHAKDPAKYPLAAAVRRRDVHSKLSAFRPDVVDAVDRALHEGPLDIPANATDYAASWIDASKKYKPLTAPKKGVNRLWTRAAQWQGYEVV